MTGIKDAEMKAHLERQQIENALDLLDKGESLEHIAPRLGLTHAALVKKLERAGVGVTHTRPR